MSSKTKKEFYVFATIGIFNTLMHLLVVISLVEKLSLNPTLSNTIAFLVANTISFFLNSSYTFKTKPSLYTYKRFILASLFALFATISLSAFAELMKWHYLIGVSLVIFISPVLTFALQKYWTFKKA